MSSILFGNGTDMVHWKPNPSTRGTFDILTTCIITLLLCVWTAVHLNISPPGSFWEPRFRKVGWLVIALLAPELIAYTAWYQRQQALSIAQEVNKIYGLPNPPSWQEKTLRVTRSIGDGCMKMKRMFSKQGYHLARQPTLESQKVNSSVDRHPWTIVHGFYANMGGFAILIPSNLPPQKKFLPTDKDQMWFITNVGLRSLLDEEGPGRDEFSNLSEDEIKSKSKANSLAKTLVCIQALWFILQCLTRVAQRIPISLLELNTCAHAICALLIYLLWWEKPFEVDLPTIVHNDALWNACAWRWMTKYSSPTVEKFLHEWHTALKTHPNYGGLSKRQKLYVNRILRRQRGSLSLECSFIHDFDLISPIRTVPETGESTILATGQNLVSTPFRLRSLSEQLNEISVRSTRFPLVRTSQRSRALQQILATDISSLKLVMKTEDILRWNMAWKAIQWCKTSRVKHVGISSWEAAEHLTSLLIERCGDTPGRDTTHSHHPSKILAKILTPTMTIGFSIATLVYGGIHLLAWHANFHLPVEQSLWRLSAAAVAGGLPLIYLLSQTRIIVHKWPTLGLGILRVAGFYLEFTISISLILVPIAYVLARAYLVVECFINITHLPAGVYDVPNWSAYFPHVT